MRLHISIKAMIMKNKNLMTIDVKKLSRKELEKAFENMRELSKQKTKLIEELCKKYQTKSNNSYRTYQYNFVMYNS